MPSPRERHRNNVKMGIFIMVSLLLALGVVMALTDAWTYLTTQKSRYTVSFSLESGVSNLKSGSEVRVGGLRLGEVVTIQPRFTPGEPFQYIDVVFTVDANVELYNDAIVFVTAPLIGADAWIDIPYVGNISAGTPPNNELAGADRIGMMTTLLGAKNASRADEMFENALAFTSLLARLPQDYEDRMLPIVDNVGALTGDAQALVTRIRHEDWPSWKAQVDEIVGWAVHATDALDAMMAEAHRLLSDTRGIVGENRERIEQIMVNVSRTSAELQEFIEWVNVQGRERLVALLDSGISAMAQAEAALETLRRDYDGWAIDFGFILANSSHASQQLKLAMTEIRRAPWKLIHVPGKQELEHELLYDSVRAFALAASDLNAAAAAVQRVLNNHGDRLALDEEAMNRITQNLVEPLSRYEQAQQQLLNVLLER